MPPLRNAALCLTVSAAIVLGKWFEAHVGSMRTFYQSGEYANGLVVTDARTLRSRPRSFWAGLLAQLSTDNAPEAGHYVEKASTFLFHPSRA
tara:strand:- start:317 stop:592 length:276 start_codon:yes stop_codon:yes gene_type:complete